MLHMPTPFQLRRLLLFVALGLAFFGQYLFTGEWFTRWQDSNGWDWFPNYTLASVCLLAAVAFAGLATTRQPGANQELSTPVLIVPQFHAFLLAALGCSLIGIERYLSSGESWLVQLLWMSSGVIFVAGLWTTMQPGTYREWATRDYLLVGCLTLIGLALRTWQLGELPSHIDNDIPWVGTVARDMIANQDYRWIGYSDESAHLQSYTQFYSWSMRLFGQDLFGLIITSAIAGTLTLPVVYALGREMYGPRVGLIAMALLAFNYTHIHFSRTMFGPKATLFATLTFYLLFRGLRTREPIWFGLGGLSAGIGLLFYDSSRVIPLVALAIAAGWLLWQRDLLRTNAWGMALFGVGLVIGFGPMLGYMLTHLQEAFGRGHEVTIWSPSVWDHATSVYGVSTIHEVLLMQATRTFLTFHLYGDQSPQFAFPRPMVDTFTAAFLVIGIGVLLRRLRDTHALSLLVWLGLTLILGGVLTYDPPFWPHLNIALPAVVLIAAIGADKLITAWPESISRWMQPSLQWILVAVIGFTAIQNWGIYYTFAKDNAGPRNRIARYISTLPTGYRVILVSDEYTPDHYAFRFFNPGVPMEGRTPEELETQVLAVDRPLAVVLENYNELLPIMEARYPDAEVVHHTDPEGYDVFVTLRMAPTGTPAPLQKTSQQADPGWLPGLLIGLLFGWGGHVLWIRTRPPPAKMPAADDETYAVE